MNKYAVIGKSYRKVLKPIFFKFDPENVHDRMSDFGKILGKFPISRFVTKKIFSYEDPILTQKILGIEFKNPIGLSAGFDKNAKLINILPEIGFGFMEIGSITYNPYEGNPRPRLIRLPKSKGLVVYYGLMNDGVKVITQRIKKMYTNKGVLGLSIAKTNAEYTSKEEEGIVDYYNCLKYAEENPVAKYYTINISCPNTFGGEPFTTPDKLEKLLNKLDQIKVQKPIFIKMPINLSIEEFDELLQVCLKHNVQGVIIGNLTKVRDADLIKDPLSDDAKGGISGKPTESLNNELISYTYKKYGNK